VLKDINKKLTQNKSDSYQIRIKGHLGSQWSEWFPGMTITLEECGNTLLSGTVTDQSALHGLLKRIRDLGMPLLSVAMGNSQKEEKRILIKKEKI